MKIIVTTGASDGIGAEMARQLAQRHGVGVALVLAARDSTRLAQVAGQCTALGAQTLVVATDVGIAADCQRLVAAALDGFGRMDVLINNADRSAHDLLQDVRAEDLGWYQERMRVNLWGSVWCTHAALKGAGISVTTAVPAVVATQIRYRGFNAAGVAAGSSGLKEDAAMLVEECARRILRGLQRRDREVVMAARAQLARWLKLLAPGVVKLVALAALKNGVKPQ